MKDRIKEVRKHFSETQMSFADRLNVSKSTIEAIEYGRREATSRIIADICREYKINESWLRTGDGEMLAPLEREQEIAQITAQMFKEDDAFRLKLHKILAEMSEAELNLLKEIAIKIADGEL